MLRSRSAKLSLRSVATTSAAPARAATIPACRSDKASKRKVDIKKNFRRERCASVLPSNNACGAIFAAKYMELYLREGSSHLVGACTLFFAPSYSVHIFKVDVCTMVTGRSKLYGLGQQMR